MGKTQFNLPAGRLSAPRDGLRDVGWDFPRPMDRRPSPEFDMRTAHSKLFRYCTIACCSIIVANGCMLDRRPIFSPGQVVPGQYCPGDMLTASYDFLGLRTCTPRTAGDCERNAPTVTITSSPVLFPSTTLQSYRNSVSFTASGDRVDVNFF